MGVGGGVDIVGVRGKIVIFLSELKITSNLVGWSKMAQRINPTAFLWPKLDFGHTSYSFSTLTEHCYLDLLVAGEIGYGLASALPFAWRWAKSFVFEAIRLGPNSGVKHSNDDVAFDSCSLNLLGETNEVPWPCCVELFPFIREHRNHLIHSWKLDVTNHRIW